MLKRTNFPFFEKNPNLVYLDGAATSQKPKFILDEIVAWYTNSNANIGRGLYDLAILAQDRYEAARQTIAVIFKTETHEVIFTKGTTEGINLLANGLDHLLKPGQSIVVSQSEHHSNYLPWLNLAKKHQLILKEIPLKNGLIDLAKAKELIDETTFLVAVNHASNILGQINPIKDLAEITRANNSLLIVDGAQVVAHQSVSPWELGCDAYAFSGHKAYGENGSGVVLIKAELQNKLAPTLFGGEMVKSVHNQAYLFADGPAKFEGGTQNPAAQISLSTALNYLHKHYPDINQYETGLRKLVISELNHPSITIHNPEAELPIVTFSIKNIPAHDIGSYLNEKNIAVRVGFLCSQPLAEKLNPAGVVRVSLGLWNTPEDIKKFGQAIKSLIEIFN